MNHDETGCCSQFDTSRRRFLQGLSTAAAAGALTSLGGGIFRQVAFADESSGSHNNNVMVVLSLRGGADGLSMVVPHGDPGYLQARPHIAVPRPQLIQPDGFFGLHPEFAPMQQLWRDGKFAAVHAVGLPAPNRSHFEAMEEVEEADPGASTRTGWLNRLVGDTGTSNPDEAVQLGTSMVPTSLYGPTQVLAFQDLKTVELPGGTGIPGRWKRASLDALWSDDPGPLGRGARAALTAVPEILPLRAMPELASAHYPRTPLGDTLADSARLIRGNIGVKVITVDYGSWDMHVNLGTLASGGMKTMVAELAQAIAAFFDDLGGDASRVTLVTVSEFGRRVAENGDKGLDHGYGNAMLLVGAGVKGGQYYSKWPGLGNTDLIDGDLAVTRDYRSILTEVVSNRFNPDMTTVFPQFQAEAPLGVMRAV